MPQIFQWLFTCYFCDLEKKLPSLILSAMTFLFLYAILSTYSFIHFAGLSSSQLASSVFSLGTVAVLPFYTLMVLAPKAELVCFLYKLRLVLIVTLLFRFFSFYLSCRSYKFLHEFCI